MRLYKITLEQLMPTDCHAVAEAIRNAGWEPKIEQDGYLED